MGNGIPLEQVAAILLSLFEMIKLGFTLTALALPVFVATQWLLKRFGFEELDPNGFKELWDIAVRTLYSPVRGQIGQTERPENRQRILLYLGFGVVVLVLSVVIEVLSLYAVTGVALAQYHIYGSTFSLGTAYNNIVAGVILFAIASMTYGSYVVQHDTEHA